MHITSRSPARQASRAALPPFATSLIAGGLKATLGFSYVLLLLSDHHGHHAPARVLVAVVALKHFGSAMALANQRLHLFTTDGVSPATF